MITVPITIGFDSPAESIGHAYIDETKLPVSPNWCLALGFKALDTERIVSDDVPNKLYTGKYELVQVGIVDDGEYIEYLKQARII